MVGMAVMMTVVMMMMCLSSHIGYRCRYCQNGRIFILDELTNTSDDEIEEQGKPDD